ncbi:phytanoyl-CoA dioxygenase family protein [Zavarzinia sp.]|uniref:phytanoyl-CoA dioxygenase family protein n=1 Tax=Zavarzinia sp. TaxID=2027920 RepID=UPI003BB790BF
MSSAQAAPSDSPIPATSKPLGPHEVALFERDGFVIVPGFFSPEEIAPLHDACVADPSLGGRLRAVADSDGNAQEVIGWTDHSDDYVGMVPRMARLVAGAAALLGKPVYHWHSKLSLKRPHSVGRWDWHQDYPYWYDEGCLWPDMLTAMIAVDEISTANGCVQLVKGSHRVGRINHVQVGEAIGCDPVRLALLQKQLPTVPAELSPGDVCFFHGNILHASSGNPSDRPRTIMHCTYNTIDNSPFITEGQEHHAYRPIDVVPDDAILAKRWDTVFDRHSFTYTGGAEGKNGYGYKIINRM